MEEELIRQSKDGDLDSFNQLVENYQGRIYNTTLRMLGIPQDAEDATQETFISAWKAIRNFRGGNFVVWLSRIASNTCTDILRNRQKYRVVSFDDIFSEYNTLTSPTESPEDYALREELSQLIGKNLLLLSEEQRLVVILADLQGLSYEEIAQVTKCPTGTVKSRLNRGRANLHDLLLKHREFYLGLGENVD